MKSAILELAILALFADFSVHKTVQRLPFIDRIYKMQSDAAAYSKAPFHRIILITFPRMVPSEFRSENDF